MVVLFQAIGALVMTSEGDMRKAITYLQSAARLKGGDKISTDDIMEIAGVRSGSKVMAIEGSGHGERSGL